MGNYHSKQKVTNLLSELQIRFNPKRRCLPVYGIPRLECLSEFSRNDSFAVLAHGAIRDGALPRREIRIVGLGIDVLHLPPGGAACCNVPEQVHQHPFQVGGRTALNQGRDCRIVIEAQYARSRCFVAPWVCDINH